MDIEKVKKHLGYDKEHILFPPELPRPTNEALAQITKGTNEFTEKVIAKIKKNGHENVQPFN